MTKIEPFNAASSGFLSDFWLHALLIIPIKFGILHSTPLGPLLSGWFESLWSAAGFEFAGHGAAHAATEAATSGAFCHMHGAELVCH
jgi:hypothetical protein